MKIIYVIIFNGKRDARGKLFKTRLRNILKNSLNSLNRKKILRKYTAIHRQIKVLLIFF